jgi:ubiquinone/menaquinone biosynthesis C-methylase UbiE
MSDSTPNYHKHTSANVFQRWFIDQFYDRLFELLRRLPGRTILDVGCGEGFTLQRIIMAWPNTYELTGIDSSAAALKAGRELHPTLRLEEGNSYSLPYPSHAFDVVLCTEVLEHLADPARALAEIRRVSKGYALLSVPHEPWFRAANFLRGKNLARLGNDREHIQHWSSRSFQSFVEKNHFEVLETRQPFPWTIVAARGFSAHP